MKNRTLIVYHRPPYEEFLQEGTIFFKENSRPNGIIPLLKSVIIDSHQTTWIAASHLIADAQNDNPQRIEIADLKSSLTLKRVSISSSELHDFYHVTSKEGFWPILHSFPERFNCSKVNWQNFLDINERFAKAAIEEMEDDTVVWIHDYNLWMVPHFIRNIKNDAKIAFCLHTPFPSADIFNILPWRSEIISSLLCCDLITFAIPRYIENFVSAAGSSLPIKKFLREPVTENFVRIGSALNENFVTKEIIFDGHTIKLEASPVGTDCELITEELKRTGVATKIKVIKNDIGNCKLIFSASRLDYIKGTDKLLEWYIRFLTKRKDLLGKIILKVIAVKPAEGITIHSDLESKIIKLVFEIKEKYQTHGWTPVIYSEEALSFQDMICWYAASDILVVPSLRDGTNLVCKEFIASKGSRPGTLVISEFLGAAIELNEAVTFNPYCENSMDNAMDEAYQMHNSEQILRNTRLYERIMISVPKLWANQLAVIDNKKIVNFTSN